VEGTFYRIDIRGQRYRERDRMYALIGWTRWQLPSERRSGVAAEQCDLSRTRKFNADYSSRASLTHRTSGLRLSSSHDTLSKYGARRHPRPLPETLRIASPERAWDRGCTEI